MGHGADHSSDIVYEKLENTFREKGYKNVFVGNINAFHVSSRRSCNQ